MEGAEAGPSLIKRLASCDRVTRDRTVRTLLNTWLPSQPEVSEDDMKILWKGLFYCVWHADKLPVQTELIEMLSSAIHSLNPSLSLEYLSVFLITMRREWTGIDGLRLDKFYLLIRRFLHCFFVMLKKWSSDLDFVRRSIGVLVDRTFLADDNLLGNGVNYHIASVLLEEIRPFFPVRKEVLEVLLEPLVRVMGRVTDKVLVTKIKSNVFDVLIKTGRSLLEFKKSETEVEVDSSNDLVVLGTIALVMGFSSKFYELGSSAECYQGHRKVLLGLHEDFLKLEKDLATSGIEISIPEVNNEDCEDKVQELVPVAYKMETDVVLEPAEANAKKRLKKFKKAEKASIASGSKDKKDENVKNSLLDKENDSEVIANGENSTAEQSGNGDAVSFNETAISNLKLQFEKVAGEVGLDNDVPSVFDSPILVVNGIVSKKRKRSKGMNGQQSKSAELTSQGEGKAIGTVKIGEKSAKRVKFSMKNNLVWKPQCPLPPQSLRLPPSVTPRGSALKKGVPPGPIREMPTAAKKVKRKAKSVKKSRKGVKIIRAKRLKM
ncbi:hypothetical protein SLEP1_g30207 [Rubroshorea leprosula]|uniref:Ribosomal RNA processing protein 1 homolog n=1 Tax=Rubroshorea leprosula TaxID=152421 RepID=A0AAV5K776_9ROSI|nr:hypothetical protein SLEP1_g30207 [Rubroshorea leprosula]